MTLRSAKMLGPVLSLALLGLSGHAAANAAPSPSASPSPSPIAVQPQAPVQQTLTLVGASDSGVAAIQGDLPNADNRLLTGAYGTTLANRGTSYLDPYLFSGNLTGRTLRYQENGGPVEQLNLFNGRKTAYPLSLGLLYASDPVRIGWTPDGWLDWSANPLNAGGVPSATLIHRTVHGSTVTSTDLVTDVQNDSSSPEVTAQADTAGVLERSLVMVDGTPMQRLALSTYGRPGIDTLALIPYDRQGVPSPSDSNILQYALSPTMISWVVTTTTLDVAGNETTTYVLNQRARKGGAIHTFTLPAGYAGETIVAAQKRIAVVQASTPDQVQILSGSTWRSVRLPGAASGLAGTGYNVVTAVSGPSTIAGIYQLKTTGDAIRVATAPGPDPVG